MKHFITSIVLLIAVLNVPISQAGTFSVVKYGGEQGGDPYINTEGAPGVETAAYAIIRNDSDEVATYTLSVVDSQLTTEGSFALKNVGTDQNEVGLWGSVEPNEITLDPGTNQVVMVKFKIPENQNLGIYWGGLSAIQKPNASDEVSESNGEGNAESSFVTLVRNSLRVSVNVVSKDEYVPVETVIPSETTSSENNSSNSILKYSLTALIILGTAIFLALNSQKVAPKKGKSKKK